MDSGQSQKLEGDESGDNSLAAKAYNFRMARGWESKSVEAQMEESGATAPAKSMTQLTPEELQRRQKKADLILSRRRVVQQLAESSNERYSGMLLQALAALDEQIAALAA